MSDPSELHLAEGEPKHFDVELFVVHPTIDPREITKALGLDPSHSHRVGDRRMTPKGTLLDGTYPDTRWRYCTRHEIRGQHFARALRGFVNQLMPHRQYLHHLRSTAGQATLIIQFLGDGYLADSIANDTLSKIVDLKLDFGIECFTDPQNEE